MKMRLLILAAGGLLWAGVAMAGGAASERQAVLAHYAAEAKAADPSFTGFSAAAGQAFFLAHPGTGRPQTPSCSGCHTTSPRNEGRTRAGKLLAPMAVSLSPQRFTSLAKVEKWFRRNCHTVYGRACTAQEKGNFISFMASQ
jgi:mono/diheme cytochrome c family protein